ncbi:MAG TPA: RNA polymerase sigma factor [Thermoanaerobaculia bacterium]|jgi:RNA polymerase sigma-70 factor (ECF subfamily)|nr:RNA polymerase sigma factor [Thermoanaerobaculia bacterium]
MTADGLILQAPFAFQRTATSQRTPKRPMDEAKFEAFYRKTAGRIWSYIFRMTGNAATADDLLQKTFFRFLRSNPAIVSDDHLRHYIFKTATNLVFDHFRETKRHREAIVDEPAITESRAGRDELRHDMMRAFAELKPQERALLWLAHVEGSSHEEIADALDVKEKSVKVMLFRARKRLAAILTKRGLGPEIRHA